MESENNNLTENEEVATVKSDRAASVSSLSFVGDKEDSSVRIIVDRDLGEILTSFTVSYRFSGLGKGGVITESRFFSLVYDREGLNSKDRIAIRIKVPDGYEAVGCTAFVSRIGHADGRVEQFAFSTDDGETKTCRLEGFVMPKTEAEKKKASKTAKGIIISVAAVAGAALIAWGGLEITKYNGMKTVVNGLINNGRYGEAYKVADECGSAVLKRVACSNIVTKSLNDHDYKTAYIYSTLNGRESTVFKRVEYEIINSGTDAFTGDELSVLKKLENDDEFDRTINEFIKKACEKGDYTEALAAVEELRSPSNKALMRRNLIVDGVCRYSYDSGSGGMDKYDKALKFLSYYQTDDKASDASIAADIVRRCLSEGDCAGAIVLSDYFGKMYDSFEIDPASIEITPSNSSIAHSLDCAYPMLTAAQKRAYHAQKLDISEEVKIIQNGTLSGTNIIDAVSVATYENRTAVLRTNGSVTHIENGGHNTTSKVPSGVNGVQIAVGLSHTVILNADGTVTAVGDNSCGQCDVSSWKDIVEIAAGRNFTLGLRSDGTLVACGSNKCGQCTVGGYNNVVSIEACDQCAVMLFADGSVKLRGERSMGLDKASSFTNVEQIKAGGCTIIVKKTDGTFDMADGCINASSGDVSGWIGSKITEFAVGSQCVAYTDQNGTLNIIGDGEPK